MIIRARIRLVAWLILGLVFLRGSIADLTYVTGRSMQPALVRADFVYLNKLAYGLSLPFLDRTACSWAMPRRGDVVVLFSPVDGRVLVKRVAGLPGDHMEGRAVPDGTVFVLGDNRDVSFDSRQFGCVARARVVGRVEATVLSFDPGNYYLPRAYRWFRSVQDNSTRQSPPQCARLPPPEGRTTN